jgi:hypothetical protein
VPEHKFFCWQRTPNLPGHLNQSHHFTRRLSVRISFVKSVASCPIQHTQTLSWRMLNITNLSESSKLQPSTHQPFPFHGPLSSLGRTFALKAHVSAPFDACHFVSPLSVSCIAHPLLAADAQPPATTPTDNPPRITVQEFAPLLEFGPTEEPDRDESEEVTSPATAALLDSLLPPLDPEDGASLGWVS